MRSWGKTKGYSDDKITAILQRLALALVTESSGGYIYANDGTAYDPNKNTAWNGGLSSTIQNRVSYTLRQSLSYPHNRIGSNGRSTGMLQQISKEANQSLDPNIKWGWSNMADTMDPVKSAIMFVEALRVTDDPVYQKVKTLSPVIADTLRVQQPLASEVAKNYGQKQLDWALSLSKNPANYFSSL